MTKYRNQLPQSSGEVLLADSGLETTLLFNDGIDLPEFASFPLLDDAAGEGRLREYYVTHAGIAIQHAVGIVLETPTWRASADWGAILGYDADALADVNRRAVELVRSVRDDHETARTKIVVSGSVGPRGDGYVPGEQMTAAEAETFHQPQIDALAAGGADMASFQTASYVAEAIGVARAADNAGLPIAVCFTVETDGKLPSGQTLRSAIEEVELATDASPAYYGINCAHPTHFEHILEPGAKWVERIGMLRANASSMSHEELDNAEVLDAGDPTELGAQYANLRERFPHIQVLGGCCGTDHRHVSAIADACLVAGRQAGTTSKVTA
jgi:S-methylmethionine-dependent homocysteine/selenocysteine methylase